MSVTFVHHAAAVGWNEIPFGMDTKWPLKVIQGILGSMKGDKGLNNTI